MSDETVKVISELNRALGEIKGGVDAIRDTQEDHGNKIEKLGDKVGELRTDVDVLKKTAEKNGRSIAPPPTNGSKRWQLFLQFGPMLLVLLLGGAVYITSGGDAEKAAEVMKKAETTLEATAEVPKMLERLEKKLEAVEGEKKDEPKDGGV